MRRASPSLPVTPGMLRHFAVLTLVITSCIGIFASGENHELAQQQVQAQARPAKSKQTNADQPAPPQVIGGLNIAAGTRIGAAAGGGDYVESGSEVTGDSGGGGGGSSDVPSGGDTVGGYAQAVAGQPMIPPPGTLPPPPGGPQGTGTNQRGGPPRSQPPRAPTGEELERMLAASRQRSAAAD